MPTLVTPLSTLGRLELLGICHAHVRLRRFFVTDAVTISYNNFRLYTAKGLSVIRAVSKGVVIRPSAFPPAL